jgi:hypothetical protein
LRRRRWPGQKSKATRAKPQSRKTAKEKQKDLVVLCALLFASWRLGASRFAVAFLVICL